MAQRTIRLPETTKKQIEEAAERGGFSSPTAGDDHRFHCGDHVCDSRLLWQDVAASITTGMILHLCYEAALEGRIASLADLAHVFTKPGCSFRERLEQLLNYPHEARAQLAHASWRTHSHASGR
jgi:hypothetical protein